MLLILAKVLGVAAAVLWLVSLGYQIVLWAAPQMKKVKGRCLPAPEKLNRYAILIAARNEEAVLPQLIRSLQEQDYPQQLIDIYVVADNCTDGTARAARAAGAIVYQRANLAQVGKGYALDWLLDRIREQGDFQNYDGFFVFDADNLLSLDYIKQMNRVFSAGHPAVTSLRNSKNFDGGWIAHGYALWFLHESQFLNRGRMALGNCCMVSGTGYVVARALLEKMDGWPFHSMTEDAEFTAWCAVNGIRIGYCQTAVFYDEQPVTLRHSWNQRLRWVKGYMQVLSYYGGRLICGMFKKNGLLCMDKLLAYLPLFVGAILSFFSGLARVIGTWTAGGDWTALMSMSILGLAWSIGGIFLLGVYTTIMQWKNIELPCRKKVFGLFTFPLFMATYLPVAVAAVFAYVRWKPIPHTPVPETTGLQYLDRMESTG